MGMIYPVIMAVSPEAKTLQGRTMVQHLSGLARLAVSLSAGKSGIDVSRFRKNDDGMPLPEKGTYWSASHKRDYVAGIAAVQAVGIDVEKIKDVRAGMYAKAAHPEEWRLFGKKDPDSFFRCWTAKEAVLKIGGAGLKDMLMCRVKSILTDASLTVGYRGRLWTVVQYRFDDHLAAVACCETAVEWIRIGPETGGAEANRDGPK